MNTLKETDKIKIYLESQKANIILIKAFNLTDYEIETLKEKFCVYGWELFRECASYKKKLRALFDEQEHYIEFWNRQMLKHGFKDLTNFYFFIKKRAFEISLNINTIQSQTQTQLNLL